MRTQCFVLALALAPSAALAQATRPAGWKVRTDSGAPETAVAHQQMPPGWHITTGPAAILYDPVNQGRGRYAIEAEIFLFPGDTNEGFGVFLGGSNLEAPGASWTAFLITRDGNALVEKRAYDATSVIYPATRATSVKPHPGQGTSHNIIRVLVQGDSVIFSANGERITALPSQGLSLEGTFGFRVGNQVNLHISNLDLVTRLAPFPVRR